MAYPHQEIEKKWAKRWVDDKLFHAQDGKPNKSYLLIEFPYPSGERLHVGHARSYSCMDAVARKRRMQGQNVLFPIGWDAFGLPAENYAIKTGIHPSITTKQNIDNAREQAKAWGLSFDWDREVNTTDPNYYKWTQWIFIQLFKNGLAYKAEIPVNWCPKDKINLANEEVIDGKCERCGTAVERRVQAQWLLRITDYADRLLKDLDTVDYREDIKLQQVNWIGRKEGINIRYQIQGFDDEVEVFTTRPDTNFGATFIVVAPESKLVNKILKGQFKSEPANLADISKYVEVSKNKSDMDRLAEGKKKTGVFTGIYAVNNLNGEKLPIWISDFVMATVGTGAVVGVPGHDLRDFEFAKAMKIPVKRVVVGADGDKSEITAEGQVQEKEGTMINSGFLDGMDIHAATTRVMDYLVEKGWGSRVVSYHLRDWVFSRQHYWGEPLPMIFCPKCAKEKKGTLLSQKQTVLPTNHSVEWSAGWYVVEDGELPVVLPQVEKYLPTDTGESPLAHISEWVNVKCPGCGSDAKRETDTMPNWAGSSWYYLRYCDPHSDREVGSKKAFEYWLPVDWYNGGMEHTTLHLLYSRFWHKFLFDLGVVPTPEPYAKRTSHGTVLGPDGKRMSKSRGNVINPAEIVEKFGADTLRMYEMFIGPFDQMVAWNDSSVAGVNRFLTRVWDLASETMSSGRRDSDKKTRQQISRLIRKVDSDLETMKFNTAVSSLMEFVNYWSDNKPGVGVDTVKDFIKILAPLAPFISEELWSGLAIGETIASWSVHKQAWPTVDEELLVGESAEIVIQVNGKVRDILAIPRAQLAEEIVNQSAAESANVKKWIEGKKVLNRIYVPGKLLNIVVE